MYIHLDNDLAQSHIWSSLDNLSSLENILAAAYEGHHLVFGEVAILRALKEVKGISRRSEVVLSRLINSYAQYGGSYSKLGFKLIVHAGDGEVKFVSEGNWSVPLRVCGKLAAVGKPILLAENLVDAKLYEHAAKHYKVINRIKGLRLSARLDGAGGSTTPQRLQHIVQEAEELCICMTDSDRLSPRDIVSSSAKKCDGLVREARHPVWHVTTNARELENVLPRDIFFECLDVEAGERWNSLLKILDSSGVSFIDYSDLKEGVSVWWILKLPEASPSRDYWYQVVERMQLDEQASDCLRRGSCVLNKKAGDELCKGCNVIPGVSRRLAESALSWFDGRSETKAMEVMNKGVYPEWIGTGKVVFDYCVAAERTRI